MVKPRDIHFIDRLTSYVKRINWKMLTLWGQFWQKRTVLSWGLNDYNKTNPHTPQIANYIIPTHAEVNCLSKYISKRKYVNDNMTLYVVGLTKAVDSNYVISSKPCGSCMNFIVYCGLKRVVYVDNNGITAASSKNSTSNFNSRTYTLNTGNYSSSAYTLNTTGMINSPYMPLTVSTTGSILSRYSWGTESLESKIQTSISKLTPIILGHRRNGVVKSAAIITKSTKSLLIKSNSLMIVQKRRWIIIKLFGKFQNVMKLLGYEFSS